MSLKPPSLQTNLPADSREGHPNVFTRLQALFPSPNTAVPSSACRADADDPTRPQPMQRPSVSAPKFLKVRIITWNMHDSIPKGDLEELLGAVDTHAPSVSSTNKDVFPNLAADPAHPYHLVVVAGQECPSSSGIPVGLSAGFKLQQEKDKDKQKDRDKDKDKEKHKDKAEKDLEKIKARLKDKEKDDASHPITKSRGSLEEPELTAHSTSGWTSLVENWLCGGGADAPAHSNSLGISDVVKDGLKIASRSHSTTDLPQRVAAKEPKRGPYQLLVKERMMGIYMAVFVNKDMRGLVRGTSKSVVTAGLIGGRVGNKGGVGISLNIDGTSLLFVNAHLAAHEGRVSQRLADFAKIKSELTVDDFLSPDDSRVMAEDLTDRFDFTFLCGDLNFRLDISRLHADWLIARQEYAQALAFDQLRNLMLSGEAFVDWNEAPINFPPTFKYDVLRTLKSRKSRKSLRHWRSDRKHRDHDCDKAKEKEKGADRDEEHTADDDDCDDDDDDAERANGGELASIASTAWTSGRSRANSRAGADDSDYFPNSPASALNTPDSIAQKLSIAQAAHKAKSKWMALMSAAPLSPGAAPAPGPVKKWNRAKALSAELLTPVNRDIFAFADAGSAPATPVFADESPKVGKGSATKHLSVQCAQSVHSSVPSEDEDEGEKVEGAGAKEQVDLDKGVYDSSSKKRVPSWCDRILWKSTAFPEPEEEPIPGTGLYRPRTRVGQFIAHAFRPLSSRNRRASVDSVASNEPPPVPPKTAPISMSRSSTLEGEGDDILSQTKPFSRFVSGVEVQKPPLQHSLSNDSVTAPVPIPAPRRSTAGSDLQQQWRRAWSAGKDQDSTSPFPASPRSASKTSLPLRGSPPPPPPPPKDGPPTLPPIHRGGWRGLLPNFLTRDEPQPPTPPPPDPPAYVPRRGDVVNLAYDTLDDRGMRRLEGRSDHRPVIGSYAIYI